MLSAVDLPFLLFFLMLFKCAQEKEHLFGQMRVAPKLCEEARERVVVHQQCCRGDIERGGDHRESVNSDRAPAVLVVDECVARPGEPRR